MDSDMRAPLSPWPNVPAGYGRLPFAAIDAATLPTGFVRQPRAASA